MYKNILIISIILLLNNLVFSQEAPKQIENSISNLKEKLILNEEQVESIRLILLEFTNAYKKAEADSSKLVYDANNKIESFLDRKQRVKFDVIKVDWWKKFLYKDILQQNNEEL